MRFLEAHPCGLVDTWEVDHTLVVEINLQRTFVERQGYVVPTLLERVLKSSLLVSIEIIAMFLGITDTMFQNEGCQVA